MIANDASSNVFLIHVRPAEGASVEDAARAVVAASQDFAISGRPRLPPSMLSHRVLAAGDGLMWEIAFDGIDAPEEEDAPVSLADAIADEVAERLAGAASVTAVDAFADLLRPAPDRGFSQTGAGALNFSDESPGWESYADGSGEPEAGAELPKELADDIARSRAAAPVEPDLRPVKGGYMYTGSSDKRHHEYLSAYLTARAAKAGPQDRRKILAFLAFQGREGTTSAINTYDNQIVTWGTGWSGLGWLGVVLGRAVTNEALRDALGAAGVRYRGKSVYDVVDTAARIVVTGREPALRVIQGSKELLDVLIDVARNEATRDAATEAQLVTFMGGSAAVTSADTISTQALFNYITHLRHWLSGYAAGCLEWAAPQVSGSPSPARDRQLAVLVTRYFYGKARMAKSKFVPSWTQIKQYVQHMKIDGLDCSGEPFFQAAEPPSDDPFAEVPLPGAGSAKPSTQPSKPTTQQSKPTTQQSKPTTPPPTQPVPSTQPSKPATGLQNAPLAGQSLLEAVLAGKAVLQRGVHGEAVKALQEALMALRQDLPGADGDFGPGTERALKAFQSSRGLQADGMVGKMTIMAIDAALGERGSSRAS